MSCIEIGATINALSNCMIREHHTVSALINRMETKGLVNKAIPATSRKTSAKVKLTKKGMSAYKVAADRKSIHRVVSVLNAEEKLQLRRILEKLRDAALKELAVIHHPVGPPPLDIA